MKWVFASARTSHLTVGAQGNDDIAFWTFGAMSAAEYKWQEPPPPYPSWLDICDNVFNDFVSRWYLANDTCGGGLKWQVFESSRGYYYKNSISNGGFFQLAARLGRHTGNLTYYEWAERVWDWSTDIGLIVKGGNGLMIFDGADETLNCSQFDHTQWSYNPAVYLYGAAILANVTRSEAWLGRAVRLVNGIDVFISPFDNSTGVMYEQHCELNWGDCNYDQDSFKAYLSRWLAQASVLVPATKDRIQYILNASAVAAARVCIGGMDGQTCGQRWYLDFWDGTSGVGQALSALEVVSGLLVT